MKITVQRPVEIEVDAIRLVVPCRYGDEDIPFSFFGRVKGTLTLTLDLATRKIRGWDAGEADIHMKVCDEGSYYLLSGDEAIATIDQDYVPRCIPQEYGDYLTIRVAEDGSILDLETKRPWEPDARKIAECFGVEE